MLIENKLITLNKMAETVVKQEPSDDDCGGPSGIAIKNEPLYDTETSDGGILDTSMETDVESFVPNVKEEAVDAGYNCAATSSSHLLPPAVINVEPTHQEWQPKDKDRKYLKMIDRPSRSSAIMPSELPQVQSGVAGGGQDARQGQLWSRELLNMAKAKGSTSAPAAVEPGPSQHHDSEDVAMTMSNFTAPVRPVLMCKVPTVAPRASPGKKKLINMPRYTNLRRALNTPSKLKHWPTLTLQEQVTLLHTAQVPPAAIYTAVRKPADHNETLEEYLSSGSANEMYASESESTVGAVAGERASSAASLAAAAVAAVFPATSSSSTALVDLCSSTDDEVVCIGGSGSVQAANKQQQQHKEWNETEHILAKIESIKERLFTLDSSCMADRIVNQTKLSQCRPADSLPSLTELEEQKGIFKRMSEERRRSARLTEVNMLKSELSLLLKRARFLVNSATEKDGKPAENKPKPVPQVKSVQKSRVRKLTVAQLLQKKKREVDQLIQKTVSAGDATTPDQLTITDMRPPKKRKHFLTAAVKEEPVDEGYRQQDNGGSVLATMAHSQSVDTYIADLKQSIRAVRVDVDDDEDDDDDDDVADSDTLVIDCDKDATPKLPVAILERVKHLKGEIGRVDFMNNENPFHDNAPPAPPPVAAIGPPPPLPARLVSSHEKHIGRINEKGCHFLHTPCSLQRRCNFFAEFSTPEQYITAVCKASHLYFSGWESNHAKVFKVWDALRKHFLKWPRLLKDSKYPISVRLCFRHRPLISKLHEVAYTCNKCGEPLEETVRKNASLFDSSGLTGGFKNKEESCNVSLAFSQLHCLSQEAERLHLCLTCLYQLKSCHLCNVCTRKRKTLKVFFADNGHDVDKEDIHLVVDPEFYQKLKFKGTISLFTYVCETCFGEVECHAKLSPVPLKNCSVKIMPLKIELD